MNKKGKSTLELMENNMRRRNYSEQTIRTSNLLSKVALPI